jgi:hypothetical protein
MDLKRWAVVILAATGLTAGGCGGPSRPPLGKVHGKVTYRGKPLTFGSVVFMPVAGMGDEGPTGAGQPSSGTIQPDGSYELTTDTPGDGAIVGEHKVVVVAIDDATRKSIIPDKYQAAKTTPLGRTVKEGGNAIDIEVTD